MAKVDELLFNSATSAAELIANKKVVTSGKIISVYDVPLMWVEAVKTKTGIKSMSSFTRQALLEKLERDGLL